MEHTIQTRQNPAGFLEIYCEEGHWITSWNEGDEIYDFSAFKIAYTKLDADLSIYHCISDEDYNRLLSEKNEAEKLLQEKME